METIYENEIIEIIDLQKDYDFIAEIRNKTDETMMIDFYDTDESIIIKPNDWAGLLANDEGRTLLEQFRYCNFLTYLGEE